MLMNDNQQWLKLADVSKSRRLNKFISANNLETQQYLKAGWCFAIHGSS